MSIVTYVSADSGDLSLRDACLGKPRSINKISFTPSNVDFRSKDDNGKGMKGGHKEKAQKTKESPLCCFDGHPLHSKVTSTSQGMFERAISSVESILCFMNLSICDLLFFEESRTNDRFKARDQGQNWLYTNSTVVVRNDDDDADGEKKDEIDQAGIRVEDWYNH